MSCSIISPTSFAAHMMGAAPTIYSSSINWDDENQKTNLLQTVPKWNNDIVHMVFSAYLTPEYFGLPIKMQSTQYTIQFLNAFWGPLRNPFNKYPRPAKAFVFLDRSIPSNTQSNYDYYIAPLIQNATDGKYYIFDKNQRQPINLNTWISQLRNSHDKKVTVRFNVCTEYGSLPTDSCTETSYQSEVKSFSHMNEPHQFKPELNKMIPSAKRDFNTDWKAYIHKPQPTLFNDNDSILDGSVMWNNQSARNLLLNSVISWPNYKTIKDNFEKLRNISYFKEKDNMKFLRRISWLYPDDGCWTRASAVIRDLFGPLKNFANDFPRPSKIFVFGNLCVNTTNNSDGYVAWWYHTAPIVKDEQTKQIYILDPAVDPSMPLTIETWIKMISANTDVCAQKSAHVQQFNICNGYGSGPLNKCDDTYQSETFSILYQPNFQYEERQRQIELGRDVDTVLGDMPPWLHSQY